MYLLNHLSSARRIVIKFYAFCLFFVVALGGYAADSSNKSGQSDSPPSAEKLMQRLHEILENGAAHLDEFATNKPTTSSSSITGASTVVNPRSSGSDAAAARNARMAATFAYESLCRNYSAFEAFFDIKARDIAGWPEVLALAQKIDAAMKNSSNNETRRADPWILIFEGHYDDAVQLIEAMPAPFGLDLPDYERETMSRGSLLAQAHICAYSGKNDYEHAAAKAFSFTIKGTEHPMLYALAARNAAKAGRIDDAREQCRILADLFLDGPWPEISRSIAEQYHFTLEKHDADYFATHYIEAGKPTLRALGMVAIGAYKFPDAFQRLVNYYQNPKASKRDKENALTGMGASGDPQCVAFVLNVALSEPSGDETEKNSYKPVSYDNLQNYAFTVLCKYGATDAVLEYIRQSQDNVRRLVALDFMSCTSLRTLFGGGPESEDPQHPDAISSGQWVKWLRQTRRIQPLPKPAQPPPLSFVDADLRRMTHAWYYVQLDMLKKNTEKLDRCVDFFAQVRDFVIKKAETDAKEAQARSNVDPAPDEKKNDPFALSRSSFELNVEGRPDDFDILKTMIRQAGRMTLCVPETFPQKVKNYYAPITSKTNALVAGFAECDVLFESYKANHREAARVVPTLKELHAKLKALAALRAEVFPIKDDSLRADIMLRDNLEIIRALEIEDCLKNMQRTSSLFSTLSGMLSNHNPASQAYININCDKARALAVGQRSTADALHDNPAVAREYLEYCDACDRFLDTITPLLRNKSTTPFDQSRLNEFFMQSHKIEERAKSFALFAIASARQTRGEFNIYPPAYYRYADVVKRQNDLVRFKKITGDYLKYLEMPDRIPYNLDRLLKAADGWVKAGKSSGEYSKWHLYVPELTTQLTFDDKAIAPYITDDEAQNLQNVSALWNRKREEMNTRLALLKTILDTENYKNDNAAAYTGLCETLRGTAADCAKTLRQIATTAGSITQKIAKRISGANDSIPTVIQPLREALIVITPLSTENLYLADESPTDADDGKLNLITSDKLKELVVALGSRLRLALNVGETDNLSQNSPLHDCFTCARASARDTLSDLDNFAVDLDKPLTPFAALAIIGRSKADVQDIRESMSMFLTLAQLPCVAYWEDIMVDEN